MKFKRFKDMAGNIYYKTQDGKYLIVKDSTFDYTVYKEKRHIEYRNYITDGFEMVWDGLRTLKDTKEFVAEQYQLEEA